MKRRSLTLIALSLCVSVFVGAYSGVTLTGVSINAPAPSEFVSLGSSDLSGFAANFETFYRDMPPDTSSWTIYYATDSTTGSGGAAWTAGMLSACDPTPGEATPHTELTTDDDALAISCLWNNMPNESILYLPAGEYDHDAEGNVVSYDSGDNDKVLRGAGGGLIGDLSGATVFNLTLEVGTPGEHMCQREGVPFAWCTAFATGDGGEPEDGGALRQRVGYLGGIDSFGTATSWTAGYAGGTQVLTVASTSNINVPGWVYLTAGTESWSDDSPFYHVRVVCKDGTTGSDCSGVSSGQIKIDRGLPYSREWDNGSPLVTPWVPAVERVGFEDFAVRYSNTKRLQPQTCGNNLVDAHSLSLLQNAESWIDGVQFVNGWKRIAYLTDGARLSMRNSAFAQQDIAKAFDHELMQVLNTSDTLVEANYFRQAGQAVTHGSGIRAVFAYNAMDDPEPNTSYVQPQATGCTGSGEPWACCTGVDTGATCAYPSGCTAALEPWGCCTAAGVGGDCGSAYCDDHGGTGDEIWLRVGESERIDTCTTSMFLHDQSSHAVLFERNTFQCPTVVDHRNVPGGWITWFGNRGEEDGGASHWSRNQTISTSGSMNVQGGSLSSGQRRYNWNYIANHVNRLNGPFNQWAEDMLLSDNVIRDSCVADEDEQIGFTGGDCTDSDTGGTPGGTGHTWQNNDVGDLVKTGGRTMPTSLYHTESTWNTFVTEQGGTGTAPWVGADMDTFAGESAPYTSPTTCLPAKERWLGSC